MYARWEGCVKALRELVRNAVFVWYRVDVGRMSLDSLEQAPKGRNVVRPF